MITVKILSFSQTFLLVCVCAALIAILLVQENTTLTLQAEEILNESSSVLKIRVSGILGSMKDSLLEYKLLFHQEPDAFACQQRPGVTTYDMERFMRRMKSFSSVYKTQYPYFYLTYEVNSTFWGECSCSYSSGCDWYNQTSGFNYKFNSTNTVVINGTEITSVPSMLLNLTEPSYRYRRNITEETYTQFHRSLTFDVGIQTSPIEVYSDIDGQQYVLMGTAVPLTKNETTNATTAVLALDVNLEFLNEYLRDVVAMVLTETNTTLNENQGFWTDVWSSLTARRASDDDHVLMLLDYNRDSYHILSSFPTVPLIDVPPPPNSTNETVLRQDFPIATDSDVNPLFATIVNEGLALRQDSSSDLMYRVDYEGTIYHCTIVHIPYAYVNWTYVQGIREDFFFSNVWYARVIAICICAIGAGISLLFGVVILWTMLPAFKHFSKVLNACSRFKTKIDVMSGSILKDVADLQKNISFLVSQLKSYRCYIPQTILDTLEAEDDDPKNFLDKMNEGLKKYTQLSAYKNAALKFGNSFQSTLQNNIREVNSQFREAVEIMAIKELSKPSLSSDSRNSSFNLSGNDNPTSRKSVSIRLTRMTTNDNKEPVKEKEDVPVANFIYLYDPTDLEALSKFLSACRLRSNIPPGHKVRIQYLREGDQWCDIYTSMDFLKVAEGLEKDILECRIWKNGEKNIGAILRCSINVATLISVLFFIKRLSAQRARFTMATTLIISTVLHIVTNMGASRLFLYKVKQQNKDFETWFLTHRKEIIIANIFGVINVLNLEILNCQFTTKYFSFHSPLGKNDFRLMERCSLVGFVLGPVISFGINVVDCAMSDFNSTNGLSLMLGFASLFLQLMRLVVLTSFDENTKQQKQRIESSKLKESLSLGRRHVSVLRCELSTLGNVPELRDLTRYYDKVFMAVRRFSGVVTQFHSGSICAVFNGQRTVAAHEFECVRCAVEITKQFPKGFVSCAIDADVMTVATVGIYTRKSFQHLALNDWLIKGIAVYARENSIPVLVTNTVAHALMSTDSIYKAKYYGDMLFSPNDIVTERVALFTIQIEVDVNSSFNPSLLMAPSPKSDEIGGERVLGVITKWVQGDQSKCVTSNRLVHSSSFL
eukprot:PhF_6_TR565/c0_g1_i3/m.554